MFSLLWWKRTAGPAPWRTAGISGGASVRPLQPPRRKEVGEPAADLVLVGALVDRVFQVAALEVVELLGDDRQRLRALPVPPPVHAEPAPADDHEPGEDDHGQDQAPGNVVGEDLAGALDGAQHALPHGNVRDLADELLLVADAA